MGWVSLTHSMAVQSLLWLRHVRTLHGVSCGTSVALDSRTHSKLTSRQAEPRRYESLLLAGLETKACKRTMRKRWPRKRLCLCVCKTVCSRAMHARLKLARVQLNGHTSVGTLIRAVYHSFAPQHTYQL